MNLPFAGTRQVGSTDLRLPRLGPGVAHPGGMRGRVPADMAQDPLATAQDAGFRFFDTAPWYGRGLSEQRQVSFPIDRPRDAFVLTSRVGRILHRPADPAGFDIAPWTGGLRFAVEFTYTYDGVTRAYEQSLLRLGLDTIDALPIQDPDEVVHGDQFETWMQKLPSGGIPQHT